MQPRDGLHVERGHETVVGPAVPIPNPQTKLDFGDDREIRLVGNSSLALRVAAFGESHQHPLSVYEERWHSAGGQNGTGLLGQDDQHEHPRLEGADAHGDDL